MLTLASLAAFAGCSTTVLSDPHRTEMCYRGHVDEAVLKQELDAAAPCCAAFAGMTFERLAWPARSEPQSRVGPLPPAPTMIEYPFGLAISRSSPTYAFRAGKSRFVAIDTSALERPPVSFTVVPRHAGITTASNQPCDPFPPPGGMPGDIRYVVPIATFLSADRTPISEGVAGRPVVFMGDGGLEFEMPAGARYVVLHTNPSRYGEKLALAGSTGVSVLILPGAGFVPIPRDGSRTGVTSSTGSVDVFFRYGAVVDPK